MIDLKLIDKGTPDNGGQVWVDHPKLAWAPATIVRTDNGLLVARVDDGFEVKITPEHAENHSVYKSSLTGIPNLLVLGDYCEGALLHNVRTRYYQDKIYTCIGNLILISINPYKHIPDLYGDKKLNMYKNRADNSNEELSPHIFKMAQNAYDALFRDGKNQSIIITGESGAGKTEATKIILCYLANIQKTVINKALDKDEIKVNMQNSKKKSGLNVNTNKSSSHHSSPVSLASANFDDSSVESLVLRSNPILEVFGNAKTIRNDNSSRFGKFIEIFFDSTGKLKGASIANYLLEKCRLTTKQEGERNYHIFYCLIEAALSGILPHNLTDELKITHSDEFYIVREAINIPGRDECREMEQVMECLKCIGLSEHEIFEILRICAGILHLCNFSFQRESTGDAPGIVEEEMNYFTTSSKLLKLNSDSLLNVFQWRKLKDPETGKIIRMPVSLEVAFQTRDSMAKAIYSKLFDWLVFRINKSMTNGLINNNISNGSYSISDKREFSGKSIGLLDIYGFEVFDINSFEQFCINFSNEKLQQQFNHQMFQEEQQVYEGEGIDWTRINFIDNKLIIDSLEKKPNGIFPLLDSECLMPQGSDSSLLNKILKLSTNTSIYGSQQIIYKPSKMSNTSFAVSHYAGPVIYDTRGFLEKNRDQLHSDVTELLLSSESFLINELFNPIPCNEKSNLYKKSSSRSIKNENCSQLAAENVGGSVGVSNNQRPKGILVTVSGAFREQLSGLIETLNNTSPSYIRCIKPNSKKSVHEFDSIDVLRQLKCAGMLESIRIRKLGYSIRRRFVDFYNRYKILYPSIESHDFTGAKNYSLICRMILERLQDELQRNSSDNDKDIWNYSWQIGKTLVFIKDSLQTQLERKLSELCYKYCTSISSCWRMYIARKKYKLIKDSVMLIQSRWKVFTLRKEFLSYLDKRKAAVKLIQIRYIEYKARMVASTTKEEKANNDNDFVVLGSPCKENKSIDVNKNKATVNNENTEDTSELPKNVSKLWEILDSLQSNTEKTSQLVIDKNNVEITNSKLEIESLKDKLGFQESQVGSLESKIKLMESEHKRIISDFEHKLELSRLSLENETTKISETYETQKADLNSKILVLEQKNEVEKNRVLYLERLLEQSDKDLNILRKQFSAEIEDRQHEREYYMKETERNREAQQKLQGQITSLEQTKVLNLKTIDEISKYKRLYEELEKENNNLKQELEYKNDKIAQLELQNTTYLSQLKFKPTYNKVINSNISSVDTMGSNCIFSRSEMSTAEDVTAMSNNFIGVGPFTPNYYNAVGGNPQNNQRLVDIENQCSELLEINGQLRENVDILEEDKATLQKRILELFVERRTLVDENKSLNLRVRQKTAQVDALKSTLTELRNTAENSINEIRSEWENCVQRLEATQFALVESTKELDVVKSERDELLACLDDVQHFTETTMKRRQKSFSSNIGIDSSMINSSQDSDYHQNLMVMPPYERNTHIHQDLDCNINNNSPQLLGSYRRRNSKGTDI